VTTVDAAAQYGPPGLVLLALVVAAGRYFDSWLKAREVRKNAPPPPVMIRAVDADASALRIAQHADRLEADLTAERVAHAATRKQSSEELAAERAENTRLRGALAGEEARNVERENALTVRIEGLEDRVRTLLSDLDALKRSAGAPPA
jgi:hypothetical protein